MHASTGSATPSHTIGRTGHPDKSGQALYSGFPIGMEQLSS